MISVIDFFSGCGGTSLGLQEAGLKILAGIDHDADAADTYQLNFPDARFIQNDIKGVSVDDISAIMPKSGETLFAGCAPCQPFSKQNKNKKDSDPRRTLLFEFERFILELRPDHVLVENVPGLQRIGNSRLLTDFITRLESVGYTVTWKILSASHYGVPQRRTRFVLLASIDPERSRMPGATHGPKRQPVSIVRDWMSGLAPLAAGMTDPLDSDHMAMALSDRNLRRIQATPEGGGRESWPDELLLECHNVHKGHADVYGRLAWDRAASAMTTRCLSYSNGRFGHPVEDRAISVREAACLQTFPRWFKFSGTITSKGRQIGNAVPPLLASSLGAVLMGKDGAAATLDQPTLFAGETVA